MTISSRGFTNYKFDRASSVKRTAPPFARSNYAPERGLGAPGAVEHSDTL